MSVCVASRCTALSLFLAVAVQHLYFLSFDYPNESACRSSPRRQARVPVSTAEGGMIIHADSEEADI
jgi:hypothetical protein